MMTRSLLSLAAASALFVSTAHAGAVRSGFDANTLARNDDGSTGWTALPFTGDYYGVSFSGMYINNNGNVTLDSRLSTYTPFSLLTTGRQIIAPFFADVDTRTGGSPVTHGSGTADGYNAYAANWVDVDCYNSYSSTPVSYNSFQVVFIDRSDTGPGNFDFEFNYDQIGWEAGMASGSGVTCTGGYPARVGYSNGTDVNFELPGSGVTGYFLDTNATTGLIYNSLNSETDGRYLFQVREGEVQPPCTDGDADGVCDDDDVCLGDDATGDTDGDAICDDIDECVFDIENDADGDDICEIDDNCDLTPNSDQLDTDGDTEGDACDLDDDGDGVVDVDDNCQLDWNPDQSDFDGDGDGDECDTDDDNDGVLDGEDACPATDAGAVVDGDGCAIADYCPCDAAWKNHGAYQRCVAHTSEDFLEAG